MECNHTMGLVDRLNVDKRSVTYILTPMSDGYRTQCLVSTFIADPSEYLNSDPLSRNFPPTHSDILGQSDSQ